MTINTWRKAVRRVDNGSFYGDGGAWVNGVMNARFYKDDEAKDLALYITEIRDGKADIIDVKITYDFDD